VNAVATIFEMALAMVSLTNALVARISFARPTDTRFVFLITQPARDKLACVVCHGASTEVTLLGKQPSSMLLAMFGPLQALVPALTHQS
jgi:hypothetical protein